MSRELGDRPLTGWVLAYLAYTMLRGNEAALAVAEEGLALFRELDHKPGIAQALNIVGEIAASKWATMTVPGALTKNV